MASVLDKVKAKREKEKQEEYRERQMRVESDISTNDNKLCGLASKSQWTPGRSGTGGSGHINPGSLKKASRHGSIPQLLDSNLQ